MRYFEDFRVGEVIDLTPVSAGEAEMVAFARQYDPQPMHIDRDAGPHGKGPFDPRSSMVSRPWASGSAAGVR